ncbi:hypothetical protein [Massilia sp.]|uniref:hypothetical protein n=1 Tax=Massilia sp. TaxID=1882437 RepID=UPI0028AD10F6|nr:hypothetical protein [Massilia sp.]
MHKRLLVWLMTLAAWPCLAAEMVSGDYGGFLVGVDRNGYLTGYFERSTGRGQFSCIFFVSGKAAGSADRVNTWFPGDRDPQAVIRGVIEPVTSDRKPAVRLTLDEEHGGCWNVQRFASDPSTFALTERGSWEAVRIIAAKKAYFHDDPSRAKPRKAYLVTGDALRVFETRDGWVRAEYVGPDNRRTRGWVSERDLFSAKSPSCARGAPGSTVTPHAGC